MQIKSRYFIIPGMRTTFCCQSKMWWLLICDAHTNAVLKIIGSLSVSYSLLHYVPPGPIEHNLVYISNIHWLINDVLSVIFSHDVPNNWKLRCLVNKRLMVMSMKLAVEGVDARCGKASSGKCSHVTHYGDVIMCTMASQIISITIVYSTVYSGADQRKHQSSASLAFVQGIHRWSVNSSTNGQ